MVFRVEEKWRRTCQSQTWKCFLQRCCRISVWYCASTPVCTHAILRIGSNAVLRFSPFLPPSEENEGLQGKTSIHSRLLRPITSSRNYYENYDDDNNPSTNSSSGPGPSSNTRLL